jgi:hypothetical protein
VVSRKVLSSNWLDEGFFSCLREGTERNFTKEILL